MQFCAKYQTLDAVPVGVLDQAGNLTPERSYIVNFDDGTRGVMDPITFEAFFRRSDDAGAGAAAPPAAHREPAGKVEKKQPLPFKFKGAAKKKAVKKAASVVMPTGDDKPSARILAALERGPQSFTELMNNAGLEYTQAHPACAGLVAKGRIVAVKDPHDATETKRYKLA